MTKRVVSSVYVEYDGDYDMYGVFCSETGFCFYQSIDEQSAINYMNTMTLKDCGDY